MRTAILVVCVLGFGLLATAQTAPDRISVTASQIERGLDGKQMSAHGGVEIRIGQDITVNADDAVLDQGQPGQPSVMHLSGDVTLKSMFKNPKVN